MSTTDWNTFSSDLFSKLGQLEYLDLLNGINVESFLSKGTNYNFLYSLTNLKSLSLGNCLLGSSYKNNLFGTLKKLMTLDLSKTGLINLNDVNLGNLLFIDTLNLNDNHGLVIDTTIFENLKKLRELYIKNIELDSMTLQNILSRLIPDLTFLDISDNQMKELPDNFPALLPPSLNTLYVGGNLFIPSQINQTWLGNFPYNLSIFSLQSSNIAMVDDYAFVNFIQLRELHLGHNNLTIITNLTFSGLKYLQKLVLFDNEIIDFDQNSLDSCSQLEVVTLGSNNIMKLGEDFLLNLSELQELDLSNNYLKDLEINFFNGKKNLKKLSLKGNDIINLRLGLFASLYQLQSLDLSANFLIDSAIINLTAEFPRQMNILNLARNQLKQTGIEALVNIVPCRNLTFIDYSGNFVDSTNLTLAVEQQVLKSVCNDGLCHINLPDDVSCSGSVASDLGMSAKDSIIKFSSLLTASGPVFLAILALCFLVYKLANSETVRNVSIKGVKRFTFFSFRNTAKKSRDSQDSWKALECESECSIRSPKWSKTKTLARR